MTKKQLRELIIFLEGKDGCNFHYKEKDKPETISWICKGLDKTKKWLKENNLNVEQELEWLETKGAYCDCEVVFNAEGK